MKPSKWGGYWAAQFVDLSDDPSWKKTAMGWNIAPEGATGILKWISNRYNNPNVYTTENGVACHDKDFEHAIHDNDRIEYLGGYIKGFGEALKQGVNLKGYFAWSLLDNFEWQYGMSKRFGIVYVDYNTLKRTPKDSAIWYRNVIDSNGTNLNQ
jgi:beta-glucosidase